MHPMAELLSYAPSLSIQAVVILCICKCILALIRTINNIIITKMLLKSGKRHGKISKKDISF